MASTAPSPDSASAPPVSSATPPPQPSTPPPQPSTPPPQPSTPPPTQTTPVAEPNANPPDPAPTPPSNAPPPSNSPPPVDTSPPPTSNAPPPSSPASPPPSTASPPPTPAVLPPPPPQTDPPISSPPPAQTPPPDPPTGSPPPPDPPTGSPPPPPSSSPPPESTPTPPSQPSSPPPPESSPTPPSADPPRQSPPPPPSSSDPPVGTPPPPSTKPPESSPPPPPAIDPPKGSPSPPVVEPPSTSPPSSTGSPPPSDSQPASPPPVTPVIPTPVSPGSGSNPSSPGLPGHNSSNDAPQTANGDGHGGIGSGGTIAIGIVAGVLVLGFIGLVAFWVFKRKKRTSGAYSGHVIPASLGSSPRSDGHLLVKTEYPGPYFGGGSGSDTPNDHGGYGNSRAWFTYQELLEATGGFSDENLLGEGGFGYVYKGILVDGRVVAVKQLKVGGGQGEREFKAEVEIISRIHHRHLVSLVGYCILESKRLLVYEYVPNNTLHFHLHGGGSNLEWKERVKIAAGAARGIAYLHEDCHPRIIHRDIKSSNILLDNNFEARVSDFGLAKLAMDADTHVSTRVMGTFGYMAPEYATSGKLTEKSDVYSFGVVLLELITGRKPVDESQPVGDESLVEWARPKLPHALQTGDFEGLVDPRLEKNFIQSEMARVIEAAAACVRHSATKRPKMGQVVRAIDGISDSGDLSNGLKVGESQLYNSAHYSADIRLFRRMAFGSFDSQDMGTDFFSSPSHNPGYWTQSGQNVNPSALQGPGGNISGQHSHQSSQNMNFPREGRQNTRFPAHQGLGGNMSRQHSQSLQNLSFLRQNEQNHNSSAQQGLGGDISRQQSQSSQNLGFSRQNEQNVNITAPQPSRSSQNLGISRQSGQNVEFSAQQGLGGDIPRHNYSTYHSNQHSLNQGNRNLNFSREDSLNR